MKQLNPLYNFGNSRALDAGTLADEPLFARLLVLERRRCERAENRFALILVDLEDMDPGASVSTLEEIAAEIGSAMRETDITGWYRDRSVIGIILTALNETHRETIEPLSVKRVKSVLSARLSSEQIDTIRISFHVFPEDGSGGGSSNRKPDRKFYPDQEKKNARRTYPAAVKRAIDVAGSLAALVMLLPLFAVIAVLMKATSAGPVLFRQKRIGQFGEEFTFLKFRSMYVNNDPAIHEKYIADLIRNQTNSGGIFKIKNDPRITPFGKFLRKSSLDELPQFINVLRGDMSLVGPRPAIAYEFEKYSLWHKRRLVETKPGITGIWQVDGRSRTTFDEMVRMDLRYIRHQSVWLDLKILIKTPFAMLGGNGAY